jgi:phage terminase large subunit-like protein
MKASFPDLVGEHRTETVPPEPHCLVTDVEAPLEEQIFDLSQRQRIAKIHHHREADDLGRTVEVSEGTAHRRRLGMPPARLKPIYSDNAGVMLFPKGAPFLPELERELLTFPNGPHYDQVDSINQALNHKLSGYTLDNL